MSLRLEGYVDLPEHIGPGGFDDAAVLRGLRRLYVAHNANDGLDIIDLDAGRCVDSIGGLTGVAGALADESSNLVFTSNRGEDTVGIFDARDPSSLIKVPVNQDYYVSFGDGPTRSWVDAIRYGFASGGGGRWYSRTLKLLEPRAETHG